MQTNTAPKLQLTTTEIFTPDFDRVTGGLFTGNHRDLQVTLNREGDVVYETIAWGRDTAGHWINRETKVYSVGAETLNLQRFCREELDTEIEITDDLPQGISYPGQAA